MNQYINGKVVFVGDTNVGKTTIINKHNDIDGDVQSTLTASSISCSVNVKGEDIGFSVWDTAGQVDYRCMVPMFVRGAQIAVIVFNLNDEQTFENVPEWKQFLDDNCEPETIFIVGNKKDLERKVSEEAIEGFIQHNNNNNDDVNNNNNTIQCYFTDALSGDGVDELFYAIAVKIQELNNVNPPQPIPIPVPSAEPKSRCC